MKKRRFRLATLSLCVIILSTGKLSSEPDLDLGRTLFRDYCAQCHNRNMKTDLTGPALGPAEELWAEYPRADLYDWIRNSQAMIAAGHPRAVALWNEWRPAVMNPATHLSDDDIESILAYIQYEYTRVPVATVTGPGAPGAREQDSNFFLYIVLFIILAALTMVLSRVITNLQRIALVQDGKAAPPPSTIRQILMSRGVIGFVVFALVIVGGYTTVNNAIALGRQQGYAPEQPIKFSHELHAGIQGIDCQYCHDSARRSKHASIPDAHTCMNCHRAVTVGSLDGTAEITKIFAAIGFDPNNNRYIEDYETMPEDSIRAIYEKWIGDQYMVRQGLAALDRRGQALVDEQWVGIKTSLTNEVKPNIPGPIEWVRIHHLPDHVYFSHVQHVEIGKIECQQCHGKVEEMELLYQYAPLSMGWCINCHRTTEVQFTGNAYYESYARYHEELAAGTRQRVTVEDIGGLECQKCHY